SGLLRGCNMLLPRLFQLGERLQRLGGLFRCRPGRVTVRCLGRTVHCCCWRRRRALYRCEGDAVLLWCRALANARARADLRLPAPTPTATRHCEEALEEGIKGWEILVRFDQHCAQGEAEQVTVVHAYLADAVESVQAFRYRDRQALCTQQADEGNDTRCHRPASRRARAMSSLSFSRIFSVSTIRSR